MPGRVDHVEHVVVAGAAPRHPHSLGLDRDAALALDVHPVEILGAHRPLVHHAGELQHAIGQCRLAMVDVGDDAEVADDGRVSATRCRNRHSLSSRGCWQSWTHSAPPPILPRPGRSPNFPAADRRLSARGGVRNRAGPRSRRNRSAAPPRCGRPDPPATSHRRSAASRGSRCP
ncbi:hypothetical protein SDC9_132018 [bioreactor metagenome]|uniref:Uncharacterized protein n=1 Tax=bioreactor metagenome TaxID=1076179 RepID=A0A645D8K7_9ZZZZ